MQIRSLQGLCLLHCASTHINRLVIKSLIYSDVFDLEYETAVCYLFCVLILCKSGGQ